MSKQFLIIAIATLVTVLGWVTFDILHQRASVRPTPEVQQALTPISPNFDLSGLKN